MKKSKLLPLVLAVGLILSGCSKEDSDDTNSNSTSTNSNESSSLFGNITGGGNDTTSADEMRLENFTGSITLQNQSEEKAVVLGSRLVTGDNIETMTESNAYVILDQSKVLRVNEASQVEIIQEDKHLDIHLSKGTVFFNVKSALTAEESLEFHTNNVVTGVRGTSGIIHYDPVAQITQIVVLTGTVTGTTINEEQSIEAGQVAIVETLPDGTVEMTIYELEENDPLYAFSGGFIDEIQGDLNFEGDSFNLSERLRESDDSYYERAYASVISQYRDYQYKDIYPVGNPFFDATHSANSLNSESTFGYRFTDLNSDGIQEIIFYNLVSYASHGGYYTEVYTLDSSTPISVSSAREFGARQGYFEFYDTDPVIIYRSYNTDSASSTFLHVYYHMIDNQLVEIPTPDNKEELEFTDPPELHLIQAEETVPRVPDTANLSGTENLSGTVTMAENITVLGNNRTMTAQQAQGFAQALRNLETTPTHLLVIDNGESGLALLAGTMNYIAVMGVTEFDPTVLLWTGNAVETSPSHVRLYETGYKLYEENGRYYIGTTGYWGSDGGYNLGTGAFDVEYRYFFESGIFTNVSSAYHYITADGTEEMREKLNSNPGYTLAEAAVSVSRGRYDGQDLSYLHDTMEAQGLTIETYLLRNGSVQLLSALPPSNFVMNLNNGQDEPYWNSLEAVLEALES